MHPPPEPEETGADVEDAALLAHARAWSEPIRFSELNVDRLGAIAREHGLAFATAVFHQRARHASPHREFWERVHAVNEPDRALADIVGIVPGAFHGQHKHTGADGVRIAEIVRGLAPRVEVLPVRSFGGLDENAAVILDWLEVHAGHRIVLASLSKGAADLKRALASPRAARAFAAVHAWVSFSGIVQGTPLVAWLRQRRVRSAAFNLLLRFQGIRSAVIDELARGPGTTLAAWPSLPATLQPVHVVGCPLPRHLEHRWAPRGHRRLAELGPNDGGGILLGDLCALPGIVHAIWGADHYLQPSWNAASRLRAIVVAAATLGDRRQAQA